MSNTPTPTTLEAALAKLVGIVHQEGLLDTRVTVWARPLTPEEAIGEPERRDFPIITGKERMIEARVLGARGHAFTDAPREQSASVAEVLEFPLDSNARRAVVIATMNAILRHLGQVGATVHCKDEDPEECAAEMSTTLRKRFGATEVGLVGLNPAIAERLVDTFGPEHVQITDLNPDNIGQPKFGVEVWDGASRTGDLVRASDLLLVTGTTLVNDTFDSVRRPAEAAGKAFIPYGVTAAGVCHLMDIERLCPRGQDG